MTNTLKKRLKELLDGEKYYEFIELLCENELSIDECGFIFSINDSNDPGDDFLVEELNNINISLILFSALDFIYTQISKAKRVVSPIQEPVWKNSSIDESATSIPSLGFVKF